MHQKSTLTSIYTNVMTKVHTLQLNWLHKTLDMKLDLNQRVLVKLGINYTKMSCYTK